MRFVALAAVMVCVLLPFGRLNGAETESDILTFLGDQRVAIETLPQDSILVTLDRKTAVPSLTPPPKYFVIVRKTDPVEKALLQDAQSGAWKYFDLFRAAMITEGVRDVELIRTYEARLNAVVAKVVAAQQTSRDASQKALARALFEAMHKEILTKSYDIDCTEVGKVMRTGHYNCVSATILFNCLAEKAGLNVCGLEMPGHALSRIKFADGTVMNIETTCATWFDLKSNKDRMIATRERIAPAHAIPEQPMTRNANGASEAVTEEELPDNLREITPVQLVATIYYNNGVDLHAKKRYAEAIAANIKALYLDKNNEQAWTNLLAYINNWAIDIASEDKGKDYRSAAALLDEGVALDPTFPKFKENYTYVFFYWIQGLALKGNFEDARKVYALANTEGRVPNDANLTKLIKEINRIETERNKRGN
jgi:tetratricopeptide (TPR) repeat protein